MTKSALKVQDFESYKNGQEKRDKKAKKNRELLQSTVEAFDGQVFADLNGQQKDEILKVLAIQAGILEE